MLYVEATGDYYADVGNAGDGATPEDLRALVRELCRERFRRIDRFTQLALIGSARCAEKFALPSATPLYIGSGLGAVGNTIAVHEQIYRQQKTPRPADFVNTLSNSAGYYVARNLGLCVENTFVSRRAASTQAAFELAATDFSAGRSTRALIGLVDECVAPLHHHCQRLGIGQRVSMAEGSHWFVVTATASPRSLGRIRDACTLDGTEALSRWIERQTASERCVLHAGPGLGDDDWPSSEPLPTFDCDLGYYFSRDAGVLNRYFESDVGESLLLVDSQSPGRFHAIAAARGVD